MTTHNSDLVSALTTSTGTFSGESVLQMNFALFVPALTSMGTSVDDLMSRMATYDTVTEATAATVDSTVNVIMVSGRRAANDGGAAMYARVGSDPSHDAKVTTNSGTVYWEYSPVGPVDARALDFLPGNSESVNGTAASAISTYINQSDNAALVVPPGSYLTDTGFAFNRSDFTFIAEGARLRYSGTTGKLLDLNKDAVAAETSTVSNVYVVGGRYVNTNGSGSNTATGISARGISRGGISRVLGQGWGTAASSGAFIDLAPVDSFTIDTWGALDNAKHIHVPDFITTAANPQNIWIHNFGAAGFDDIGIHVEGSSTHLVIEKGYIIGTEGIVIENGPGIKTYDSRDVAIRDIDFEQGTTGEFYITIADTNSRTLRALTIEGCSSAVADVKFASLSGVEGCSIRDNYISNTATGWLTISADCTDIDVGRNEFNGLAWNQWPAITYSCAREQIRAWPYEIALDNDDGVMGSFNNDTFSGGNATIDMSTELGSFYPSMIEPLAYRITGEVEDSGSAAAASTLRWSFLTNTSVVSGHRWRHINIEYAGWPDGQPVRFSGLVYADAGDIAHDNTASGTLTTTVRAKVDTILMGGGKPG